MFPRTHLRHALWTSFSIPFSFFRSPVAVVVKVHGKRGFLNYNVTSVKQGMHVRVIQRVGVI